MRKRMYLAIDLKSFYASVECVERGLDPFKVNLVVADPERSTSTICLAISPAMKRLGVRNRCRVHEIPPNIEYITAMPRMQLYIDYSVRIYSIYLRYVCAEDIHVYSIDECFLDVTEYLELYQKSAKELAVLMMEEVFRETGICATAGIGTNLYLCKVAMDVLAKHSPEHIGYLDERLYREQMWKHCPLTDFWRIGRGTAKTLGRHGIFTMGDLARLSLKQPGWLHKQFGVDAELLIDHAWGYESCTMQDIKHYEPKTNSLSSGQVLMRNYSFEEAGVVVREMAELLILQLVEKGLVTRQVSLSISYDHRQELPTCGRDVTLPFYTSSTKSLLQVLDDSYRNMVLRHGGIRRIQICFGRLKKEEQEQMELFTDWQERSKERQLQYALLAIRRQYGTNAVMRGCNLLECSNFRERNRQIGGHRA